MFTSENDSRLVNDNAICLDEKESLGKRISRRSVSTTSITQQKQIDTTCEGGGSQVQQPEQADADVENYVDDEQCTEEEKAARRRRTRRSSHRRSTSCSTVSPSSSYSKSTKRKRKKKHKHHHRHRSNRANDSYQPEPATTTPTPKVNPIFVWIKQDDTRIVQVLCEDYDRRNRIRLTKTSNGWRSIPLTETLEKRWPFAVAAENVQNNQLVKSSATTGDDSLPVVTKPDNPLENKQEQTDNYKNDVCNSPTGSAASASPDHQLTPPAADLECRISSTSMENHVEFSPALSQRSPEPEPAETITTKVPYAENADPFDSDESTQDDLRSIINKVQTDSLYSDDEQIDESLPSAADYCVDFCPVNSTCCEDNELRDEEDSNTIQCAEVSGNEIHYSESDPDTNFESQNNNTLQNRMETSSETNIPINQIADNAAENDDQVLATVTSNVEILREKSTPDETTTTTTLNSSLENSFQSVTSQNENIEFTAHELSLTANEILQFNNKQKVYHDRTSRLCQNDAEYFDLRDDNVESSVVVSTNTPLQMSYQTDTVDDAAERLRETSEILNDNCHSPEESVSQSNKADYVLEKESANLKREPTNRCSENEVSESYGNVTEISDNEASSDDRVNSSSKCEFSSTPSPVAVISHIKTENVDTHEIIDDHVDEYDHRKDGKTPDSNDKIDDIPKKTTNSVVLRTPLCQTLKTTKSTCRKIAKKSRTLDDLKIELLPAHIQTAVTPPSTAESFEDPSHLSKNTFADTNVQNEPLDLGVCRSKQPDVLVKPPPVIAENREHSSRKRIRSDDLNIMGKSEKEILEPRALKKSRLLDLLTSKHVPNENSTSDPLEQLKDVLANPKYSVPDPLLVPKARLSALVSCPGKEIPRLLARRAQDLSYFSILSDPDVLVVSLSHLQSLIKKPINEDEIQKYQKQTEEIRARMRQECFANNYENMANGNWNQCYWLPSFQQHSGIPVYERASPEVLSMMGCGIPPASACCGGQDIVLPANNGSLDYHKQMQYQKDAALWQELALQQISANHPSYDQFNNNISGNCDLAKDCSAMAWNQEACPNYGCYPTSNTLPIKSNTVPTKNSNHKYFPGEVQHRKSSQSFASSMPCNGHQANLDYLLTPPCDADLFAENPFLNADTDKIYNESKFRDRYDSLRQFLLNSTENVDFLQQFEASLHPYVVDEERKTFKDERQENRPSQIVRANNANTKESSDVDAANKPSRPVVPKIKVRKHLVDPNQRPTLLNNVAHHPMHPPGFPVVDHNAASHLWNPFFCR
ncbi:uncharacterized protein LOC135831149 isoform X2 [Planococcus citri]|uniref:uncharacterized protein LOC135831149 isoform X2 n=1 Tax=Planococcus citri TaxID=170843 RepID=UPI0031F98698